jgi:hypothetical protein
MRPRRSRRGSSVEGRREHRRQRATDAALVTVATVVLRDQAPELAVQPVETRIGRIQHVLHVIEEPVPHVVESAVRPHVRPDQVFQLLGERHHEAS